MNVDEAIRTRRTNKVYRPDPVPREQLDQLFELARWAPNHHLTNPWRFRVLGPRSLEALKQAHPEGAAKLDRAPTLVACSVVQTGDESAGRGGRGSGGLRGLRDHAGRPRARDRDLLAHPGGAAERRGPGRRGDRRRRARAGTAAPGLRRPRLAAAGTAGAGTASSSTWTDAAQRLVTGRARRPGVHGALRPDQLRAAARRSRAANRGAGARPRLRQGRAAAVAGVARADRRHRRRSAPGNAADTRGTVGGRRRAVVSGRAGVVRPGLLGGSGQRHRRPGRAGPARRPGAAGRRLLAAAARRRLPARAGGDRRRHAGLAGDAGDRSAVRPDPGAGGSEQRRAVGSTTRPPGPRTASATRPSTPASRAWRSSWTGSATAGGATRSWAAATRSGSRCCCSAKVQADP